MGSRKCRRLPPTLEIQPTWILTSGTSGSSSSPSSPMRRKIIFDEMLAIHWISEGQSTCDEWGSARRHCQDSSSVDYRKEAVQNKEDKTWQGVTFSWNLLPLSNGGKNMEYWLKPVGEKEDWGRHPITMDCKMNECYSSTPQKSLLRSNEVTWLLVWWPMQNVNKIKRSLSFDSNQVIQLKIFPPSNYGLWQIWRCFANWQREISGWFFCNYFRVMLTRMKLLQRHVRDQINAICLQLQLFWSNIFRRNHLTLPCNPHIHLYGMPNILLSSPEIFLKTSCLTSLVFFNSLPYITSYYR